MLRDKGYKGPTAKGPRQSGVGLGCSEIRSDLFQQTAHATKKVEAPEPFCTFFFRS